MGIKKKNKINAQFNMSSLTDIIFLLLIFFMLTSSLVAPNALNLKLPGSSNAKPVMSSKLDRVRITSRGNYYLNNKRVNEKVLEANLGQKSRERRESLKIVIAPDRNTPVEYVATVMDIALRYNIEATLAPKKQ